MSTQYQTEILSMRVLFRGRMRKVVKEMKGKMIDINYEKADELLLNNFIRLLVDDFLEELV